MNQIVTMVMGVAVSLAVAGVASAQDTAQIERGMKVYGEQKCMVCHSIAGKGNPKGALDNIGAKLKADEIREWIVNAAEMTKKTKAERKPPMKSFSSLPKEDVDGLVAYLQSLKK